MNAPHRDLQKIAHQIIALKESDLRLRAKLIEAGKLTDGYDQEMEKLHNRNAMILNEIIAAIGYPTAEKVGKMASDAAWLLIQHAIAQPNFMRKCRDLLAIAVKEGKAEAIHFAYLTDRIAVFEGKPQRYGTQFDWDQSGNLSPTLFDNLTKVNQRRKSIGLNTLAAQTAMLNERAVSENQSPSKDLQKRKEEFEAWKKKVGWTK